jgi:hypothetical protein
MDPDTPHPPPLERLGGTRFADMTHAQKWIWTGKLIVCICTFGYAFPNVQND